MRTLFADMISPDPFLLCTSPCISAYFSSADGRLQHKAAASAAISYQFVAFNTALPQGSGSLHSQCCPSGMLIAIWRNH